MRHILLTILMVFLCKGLYAQNPGWAGSGQRVPDSSTVSGWGFSTTTVDSDSVASWGFLASTLEQYAELYIPDTTYTLALTQYVWTKVINFTADHLTSEMTFADDSLTLGVAGTYVFGVSIAFEGGINGVYKGTVVVNSVIDTAHVFMRKTGVAASVGSASLLEMRNINAGDGISLWVENIGNDADIIICAVGFVIRRLGE